MMDKDLATLLDATSFQVADLIGPATVIEGAANHLLSRLPETDSHRWNVTQALGSIVAARKSLESAAEALLHIVAQDGADMLAVEVNGGEIVPGRNPAVQHCVVLADTIEVGRKFIRDHPSFDGWQVVTPRMGDALRGRHIEKWVRDTDLRLKWTQQFVELWSVSTLMATEVDLTGAPVERPQCPSRAKRPDDTREDLPSRCRRAEGHIGSHDDHEFRWNDDEAWHPLIVKVKP